jgi:hypothetical protein
MEAFFNNLVHNVEVTYGKAQSLLVLSPSNAGHIRLTPVGNDGLRLFKLGCPQSKATNIRRLQCSGNIARHISASLVGVASFRLVDVC